MKRADAEALGVSRTTLDRYIRLGWVKVDPRGAVTAMSKLNPELALVAPATPQAALELALNGTYSVRVGKGSPTALRPGVLALVSIVAIGLYTVEAIEVLSARTRELIAVGTTGFRRDQKPSPWALRALEAASDAALAGGEKQADLMVMKVTKVDSSLQRNRQLRRPFYESTEGVRAAVRLPGASAHDLADGQHAPRQSVAAH